MWAYLGQTYTIDKNALFKYMGVNFTELCLVRIENDWLIP